ncbi:MAG TPA: cytochrome c oxidase assembly protein [Streptosporangiaceae bacterium]|nr:cytochrome c oxidase assembly protein [Streptosporangiaceae bacterium]
MDVALQHWSASWPVLIAYVLLAAWHLVGLRGRLAPPARDATRRQLVGEAAVFQLGLAVIAAALVSPIGYWSTIYLPVRACQELLVAVACPGLIVLGAPWAALRLPPRRLAGLLARPVLAVAAANVVWIAWQVPVLADAAHGNVVVRLAEYATYVVAGIMFWLQLISSRPLAQHSAPLRRFVLLAGTVLASTVLGMVLVFGANRLYPAYLGAAHSGMSVVQDQQLAGAVLWMGMLVPLVVAGVALLMQWFSNEESAELAADLDRLLAARPYGWPSRPVHRWTSEMTRSRRLQCLV